VHERGKRYFAADRCHNINEKVYQLIKQNIIKFIYPPGHNLNISETQGRTGGQSDPDQGRPVQTRGEGLVVIYSSEGDLRQGHHRRRHP